ncbi:unnamed protein product [Meganyctiphanes norvegica]|uniref:Uncharacterized protein n=1 Tax=Meganyctiphanes norvegica TaxID=48144 RepID=A0AAV2Q1H6_MEGNR
MDESECSICSNTFDDASHRPRVLPCGHGFCTQCIDACINRENKSCAVCNEEFSANSATDLAICYMLEEFLNKSAISASRKRKADSVIEMINGNLCPKHAGNPLYFHCRSHDDNICHSCAMIDHPPASCDLIPLNDEIKKQSQILTVQNQKQVFIDTEKDLKILYQENVEYLTKQKQEVELLLAKIEQINRDILEMENSQEQIHEDIQGCQKKQEFLKNVENKLKATTNTEDIVNACQMATTEILQSQKCEETLSKELSVIKNKYAQVERNGIQRSCLVMIHARKMFIPTLSKDVKPPFNAKLIHEPELDLTSATSTVWMDLSACGCSLGRVFIRVMGDSAYGQQFIMLILGTNGPSHKGATFGFKSEDNIGVNQYTTESGSQSNESLLNLKKEDYEMLKKGRLFPTIGVNKASFGIMTKDRQRTCFGYFGEIITGIEVIDKIASDEYNITDITISECGIVLDY